MVLLVLFYFVLYHYNITFKFNFLLMFIIKNNDAWNLKKTQKWFCYRWGKGFKFGWKVEELEEVERQNKFIWEMGWVEKWGRWRVSATISLFNVRQTEYEINPQKDLLSIILCFAFPLNTKFSCYPSINVENSYQGLHFLFLYLPLKIYCLIFFMQCYIARGVVRIYFLRSNFGERSEPKIFYSVKFSFYSVNFWRVIWG